MYLQNILQEISQFSLWSAMFLLYASEENNCTHYQGPELKWVKNMETHNSTVTVSLISISWK